MVTKVKKRAEDYSQLVPSVVPNWINGAQFEAISGQTFEKICPHSGKLIWKVARSGLEDIDRAVAAARKAHPEWSNLTPVKRGEILYAITLLMREYQEDIAKIMTLETGMSHKAAIGEIEGAIALGQFMAGEGRRFYGRTTTSAIPNKYAMTVRQSIGVAALIIAANTPIANVAWKAFPALICGNAAIIKAAEDAPATAWIFGKLAYDAGVPPGVLNIIQGYGEEAGAALVNHTQIDLISFTGSTEVGRYILQVTAPRLVKVSLELGGKNPFVVCDDADLENAARWAILSAFSNAGQRCASGSRIIIFDSIYEEFRDMLVEKAKALKIGPTDDDDFGPVINEAQLKNMLSYVERAQTNGANILTGGYRLLDPEHKNGFYMAPTIIDNVSPDDEISVTELFGPITCLYRARDFNDALNLANNSPYGLTSCIHTKNVDRAIEFCQKVKAGVAVVNGGTYGSEPHMPFGGLKQSGNGFREPGTEALDVYSELKDIYLFVDQSNL